MVFGGCEMLKDLREGVGDPAFEVHDDCYCCCKDNLVAEDL